MGNGEWGMGNGEWGMGNGEWGMGKKNLVRKALPSSKPGLRASPRFGSAIPVPPLSEAWEAIVGLAQK
jgi:hypothetical protein